MRGYLGQKGLLGSDALPDLLLHKEEVIHNWSIPARYHGAR